MAKAARARAARRGSLPEEIVVWEILVRLPPRSLLRCRTVCRAWRRATSTRDFLLAHHGRQPTVPIVRGRARRNFKGILGFHHRAAPGHQLQPVAPLDETFNLEASCGGLLVLSKFGRTGMCFTVCNPATRQHAPLREPPGFHFLRMYVHRATGDYRLLLHRSRMLLADLLPEGDQVGCYIFTLGTNRPPRYVGGPETTSELRFEAPALFRDSLHWLLVRSKLLLVFDTEAESFRQMRIPVIPAESRVFEMDATLGIYGCNRAMNVVDIWVLHDYESEVWVHGYSVKLPVAKIRKQLGGWSEDDWDVSVVSVDGDVLLLLVSRSGLMFYIDIDGELVDKFHRYGQHFYACGLRLKQTLVQQTFFPALEGHAANDLPFV